MGVDNGARLWYGVMGEVPDAARSEVEEPSDGGYEKVVDGVHIHNIWAYDRHVGIGGTLAYSDWGDKTTVSLDGIDALRAAVDKFLDEHAVPGERNVYLAAEYH